MVDISTHRKNKTNRGTRQRPQTRPGCRLLISHSSEHHNTVREAQVFFHGRLLRVHICIMFFFERVICFLHGECLAILDLIWLTTKYPHTAWVSQVIQSALVSNLSEMFQENVDCQMLVSLTRRMSCNAKMSCRPVPRRKR